MGVELILLPAVGNTYDSHHGFETLIFINPHRLTQFINRGGREVYKKRISRRFDVLLEATGYIREVPPESGKLSKNYSDWNKTGAHGDYYP